MTYLASATVADEDELEGRGVGGCFSHDCGLLWRGDGWCYDCARPGDD